MRAIDGMHDVRCFARVCQEVARVVDSAVQRLEDERHVRGLCDLSTPFARIGQLLELGFA